MGNMKEKGLDRRIKLSEKDKEDIKASRGKVTQTSIAKAYNVSRRTIQFLWYPEQLEQNKLRRAERGGSKQYYDKDKHKLDMREHRAYKKELKEKGLI
jgi:hypothetical protein